MPLSTYAKNILMDSLLSKGAFISLHAQDPGPEGLHELAGTSRVKGVFGSLVKGEKRLKNDIVFENLPGTEITHLGFWDAAARGNFLWSSELAGKKVVFEGDSLGIKADKVVLFLE